MDNSLKGYSLVLLAASLWATIGLFYKSLSGHYSLSLHEIVFWRAAIAALALFLILRLRQPDSLVVQRRDWPLFTGFGLLGVAAFYVVYIYAITLVGVGVAAVLMYTAPAWVTLFSVLFMGERLTWRKTSALLLAITGCALVGRIYDLQRLQFNLAGLFAGLGAGLTYGIYILFGKAAAQRRYSAWTSMGVALGLGAFFLLPLQAAADLGRVLTSPPALFWLLVMGLVPTLGGGVSFNAALHWLPASNASIVATLEPAIAIFLGWAILDERLGALQIGGAVLILAAVVTLQAGD